MQRYYCSLYLVVAVRGREELPEADEGTLGAPATSRSADCQEWHLPWPPEGTEGHLNEQFVIDYIKYSHCKYFYLQKSKGKSFF